MAHSNGDAPSPLVPSFLLSTMLAMAFLPWLRRYTVAFLTALQQVNGAVFLWPLFIILGISFVSAYHNWMDPAGPASTSSSSSNVYPGRIREWKGSDSEYEKQAQTSDGSGVGLFMLLVFALVLIPWR